MLFVSSALFFALALLLLAFCNLDSERLCLVLCLLWYPCFSLFSLDAGNIQKKTVTAMELEEDQISAMDVWY